MVRSRRCQPFIERLGLTILPRKLRFFDRPMDAYFRIVPANSRFALGVVNSGALVLDFGEVGNHAETACKPGRRPHLLLVFGGNFHTEPSPQGGGSFAYI